MQGMVHISGSHTGNHLNCTYTILPTNAVALGCWRCTCSCSLLRVHSIRGGTGLAMQSFLLRSFLFRVRYIIGGTRLLLLLRSFLLRVHSTIGGTGMSAMHLFLLRVHSTRGGTWLPAMQSFLFRVRSIRGGTGLPAMQSFLLRSEFTP